MRTRWTMLWLCSMLAATSNALLSAQAAEQAPGLEAALRQLGPEQLQQLRARFPKADTNNDGTLTLEEAQAYYQAKGTGTPQPKTPPKTPPTHANVPYGPHERNVLDLWLAKSSTPAPLMIYIHGGGFIGGDKGSGQGRAAAFLAQGVSFASINYRFALHAPLTEIMRDGARAVQFIRSKAADWNVDPKRIGAFGSSAGAGMSLWLCAHNDLAVSGSEDPILRQSSRLAVAGMLDGQATYDFTQWKTLIGESPLGILSEAQAQALYKNNLYSPSGEPERRELDMLGMLTKDDAPVFLSCSQADRPAKDMNEYLHHPRHAQLVEKRCKELGLDVLYGKQSEATGFFIKHLRAATGTAQP